MPPKAKRQAGGNAGAKSGAGSKNKGSSAAASNATTPQELERELHLWKTYPDACKLIKTQSEVYHAAEEGADEEKVFIFPIVAAFGSELGAADPTKAEMASRMRLVQLLAVVDKAPEPDAASVFHLKDVCLSFCRSLDAEVDEEELEDLIELLEQMHDMAEFLQLDKRLCVRLRQLIKAEQIRGGVVIKSITVRSVEEDKDLEPLLTAAIDNLAATEVPAVLDTVAEEDRALREPLDLHELLSRPFTLEGALGWLEREAATALDLKALTFIKRQILFLLGQAIAGRELSATVLSALKSSSSWISLPVIPGASLQKLANRAVEALAVLGKGEEALKLVTAGGIKMPRHLTKVGNKLLVADP